MGRSPCCDESGLKKGPWTPEEDQKLVKYIQKHGHGSWRALPKLAGLNRCGKSCRLRWTNYLRPDIKRGKFSQEEEQTILNLHSVLGNKWSAIASHLPGRTDNEIKNFWNTHLKKKLIQMGFDPMTHRPRTDIFSSLPHILALASLKELIDNSNPSWEEQALRLQSEALQMAKFQYLQYLLQPSPTTCNHSISINNNNPTEMEIMNNLINSLSSPLLETQQMMISNNNNNSDDQLALVATTLKPQQLLGINTDSSTVQFSHLPSLETTPNTTSYDETPPWQTNIPSSSSSLTPSPAPASAALPPPYVNMEGSNSNYGDACSASASSYAGSSNSIWADHLLLEDALFHDIPSL